MTRCRTPSKTMKMRPRRRATYSCERRRERRGKWGIESDVKGGSRLSRDVTGVIIHVFRSWSGRGAASSCPCPSACYTYLYPSFSFSSLMRSAAAQRVPSPTNTTFSGISSYRTDSYKPLRDKSSISSPPVDSYQVARTHYDELSKYLASYLAKGSTSLPSPFTSSHLSPSSLQNQQIPAQPHDRNSPGLHASSSRNYPPMSTMN